MSETLNAIQCPQIILSKLNDNMHYLYSSLPLAMDSEHEHNGCYHLNFQFHEWMALIKFQHFKGQRRRFNIFIGLCLPQLREDNHE